MSDPEKLYSAREAASSLGIGAAMLRRYASTYEVVSGDEITVHRRDGRLFTETQLEVLTKARALVMRTSTDVENAVRQALGEPVTGAALDLAPGSPAGSAELSAALADALRAAQEPLLEELRAVRGALERLEAGVPTTRSTEREPERVDPPGASAHGPFVRFALWLEGRLGR